MYPFFDDICHIDLITKFTYVKHTKNVTLI